MLLNNWKNKPIKYKNWQIQSPLQMHVQSQFEMLQDIQSKLNQLQTTVKDIFESKKLINSRAKQPTKKIGDIKKHKSKKSAKRTKR